MVCWSVAKSGMGIRFTNVKAADQEVIDTFRMARQIGPDGLGAYIISMARQPSDVLAVELLQKAVGNPNPQRVVPLF